MITDDTKRTVYHHLLMHSRRNPIKAADLGKILGLSLRYINEAVRQLRKSGVMIGAEKKAPYGYFIPGSIEEARECLRGFRSEMFDMIRTHQKMRKAFREFVEQYKSSDLFVEANKQGQLEMILQ